MYVHLSKMAFPYELKKNLRKTIVSFNRISFPSGAYKPRLSRTTTRSLLCFGSRGALRDAPGRTDGPRRKGPRRRNVSGGERYPGRVTSLVALAHNAARTAEGLSLQHFLGAWAAFLPPGMVRGPSFPSSRGIFLLLQRFCYVLFCFSPFCVFVCL